jgi:selenocysteine lyase/cysteine desulfurase
LYVRRDKLHLLKRSQYGYRQLTDIKTHIFPYDPPGTTPYEFVVGNQTRQYFEVGTLANAAVPGLICSLQYLLRTGVKNIQIYRQPMMERLQQALPKFGFLPMTPEDSSSPIVSFAYPKALDKLSPILQAAGITIQLYENRVRISPSIYNTLDEIDQLVAALSQVGRA